MKKQIALALFLFTQLACFAQQENALSESEKKELTDLFHSKQVMMASLGYYKAKPTFIQSTNLANEYQSFWYQDSYFLLGFGQGKYLKPSEYVNNKLDTFAFNDVSVGLNFAIKKWSVGRRLWDISGILLSPQIGVCYNSLNLKNDHARGLKIIPALSLQLPYAAIDLRLNMDIRGGNHDYIKKFAAYPEIGIRIDGLYNILDPEWTTNGHYEGTRSWKTVDIRTEYQVDEISKQTYEVTIRTDTYHTESYNFDAYARNVGPFAAIGPRVSVSNLDYAGNTRMYGLGVYGRMPLYGIDFFMDYGKLGFASSYEQKETISNPKPNDNRINKEDYVFAGTYNATRVGGRVGLDLIDALTKFAYRNTSAVSATKFTRLMGGIGGGYAFISHPQFYRSYAPAIHDAQLNSDYTLLTTPVNDARFGENTTFFTYYISLEVGAVNLSWDWFRYKYAPLANVRTMTVSYMLPYKRLAKRYKNLKEMKRAMK